MKPINTAVIILLGFATLLWGLWVVSPFWDVFSTAAVYSHLAYLPEWFWGMFAIISGIVMMWGVARGSWKSLMWGSWIGFVHWFVIDLLYWTGDWQNTAGITVLAFVLYSLLIHINLSVNRKSINNDEDE